VSGEEFFVDLLFFNRHLQSLVAFELKRGKFKPGYAGQLNFYLNVLDEKVKLPHENPSIGIVLCKEKNNTVVEFAVKTIDKAMGVATYRTTKEVPTLGRDLHGLPGEEPPLSFLLEPDEQNGEVGGAGFSTVIGGGAEGMTHPGGIADDFDRLPGQVDGNEDGGFGKEGIFECRLILDKAVRVTIGEFVEDEGIQTGLVGIDHSLAQGFDGRGNGLFVF
jgi:hypothetical protein